MMKYLLDTNICIYLINEKPKPESRISSVKIGFPKPNEKVKRRARSARTSPIPAQRIYRLYSRENQGILIHLLTKPAGKVTIVAIN